MTKLGLRVRRAPPSITSKMGKKSKNDAPNPNRVANREVMQRLNYLYQASVYLNSISATGGQDDYLQKISGYYIRSMKQLANKKVVKMDPSIKRTLCKGCDTVLVPGSTASVRVKSSKPHGHIVTYTCSACRTSRRIPAPPILRSESDHLPQDGAKSFSDPVDTVDRTEMPVPRKSGKKKKKPPTPRIPHLFERDVGHIIFRGNERISTSDKTALPA